MFGREYYEVVLWDDSSDDELIGGHGMRVETLEEAAKLIKSPADIVVLVVGNERFGLGEESQEKLRLLVRKANSSAA